jgi:hypothetical protein
VFEAAESVGVSGPYAWVCIRTSEKPSTHTGEWAILARMGWDGFMEMERRKLRERNEGKPRRALGMPLPGESSEQLDRIAGLDRLRAEQGLVSIKEGGTISYKHIDDLRPLDLRFVTAAERVEVGCLKERVERRKRGEDAPPIPTHLR